MDELEEFKFPDFLTGADNIYRTKKYIVTQFITVKNDCMETSQILSEDVFYKRTPFRDKQFDIMFDDTLYVNGKRLPCTICSRKYVD